MLLNSEIPSYVMQNDIEQSSGRCSQKLSILQRVDQEEPEDPEDEDESPGDEGYSRVGEEDSQLCDDQQEFVGR
jgi:hypothetical protein